MVVASCDCSSIFGLLFLFQFSQKYLLLLYIHFELVMVLYVGHVHELHYLINTRTVFSVKVSDACSLSTMIGRWELQNLPLFYSVWFISARSISFFVALLPYRKSNHVKLWAISSSIAWSNQLDFNVWTRTMNSLDT